MEIAVIGTGYVGLVTGACFASIGHSVTCVDNNQEKIANINNGHIPIYEPGLKDLLKVVRVRMKFTEEFVQTVKDHNVIFLAIGTPERSEGGVDIEALMVVMRSIAANANSKKFVILKSTVPIGTAEKMKTFFTQNCLYEIEVISNPEFLKEGMAVNDFLHPDRVVIGCHTEKARKLMVEIYTPFVRNHNPIIFMSNTAAEMTKYATNAFLSVKISFINELALLADKVGADINDVRQGFTSDRRINSSFFHPGVGFGGSCLSKDIHELLFTGQKFDLPIRTVQAADEVNSRQKLILAQKVKEHFGSNLRGKTLAIWGLSFKPQTDDLRGAPAILIIKELLQAGAKIRATDPVAIEAAKAVFEDEIQVFSDPIDSLDGADALLILTEWSEFHNPDFSLMKEKMKEPVIFDGRNIFNPAKMNKEGFIYYCIGRNVLCQKKS